MNEANEALSKESETSQNTLKKIALIGAATLAVVGFCAKIAQTVIDALMSVWGSVFKINPIDQYFSGNLGVFKIPAALALTAILIIFIGLALTSKNRSVARFLKLIRFDKLPWATKIDSKTGEVIEPDNRDFLMMDPTIAIIAGKPHVGFIMGDKAQDATLFDAQSNEIGEADWVSFFDPAGLTVVNGKPHPIAKSRVLRVLNDKMEVLAWHQSQGKKPIQWKLQLWPDIAPDRDTLRSYLGIVFRDDKP